MDCYSPAASIDSGIQSYTTFNISCEDILTSDVNSTDECSDHEVLHSTIDYSEVVSQMELEEGNLNQNDIIMPDIITKEYDILGLFTQNSTTRLISRELVRGMKYYQLHFQKLIYSLSIFSTPLFTTPLLVKGDLFLNVARQLDALCPQPKQNDCSAQYRKGNKKNKWFFIKKKNIFAIKQCIVARSFKIALRNVNNQNIKCVFREHNNATKIFNLLNFNSPCNLIQKRCYNVDKHETIIGAEISGEVAKISEVVTVNVGTQSELIEEETNKCEVNAIIKPAEFINEIKTAGDCQTLIKKDVLTDNTTFSKFLVPPFIFNRKPQLRRCHSEEFLREVNQNITYVCSTPEFDNSPFILGSNMFKKYKLNGCGQILNKVDVVTRAYTSLNVLGSNSGSKVIKSDVENHVPPDNVLHGIMGKLSDCDILPNTFTNDVNISDPVNFEQSIQTHLNNDSLRYILPSHVSNECIEGNVVQSVDYKISNDINSDVTTMNAYPAVLKDDIPIEKETNTVENILIEESGKTENDPIQDVQTASSKNENETDGSTCDESIGTSLQYETDYEYNTSVENNNGSMDDAIAEKATESKDYVEEYVPGTTNRVELECMDKNESSPSMCYNIENDNTHIDTAVKTQWILEDSPRFELTDQNGSPVLERKICYGLNSDSRLQNSQNDTGTCRPENMENLETLVEQTEQIAKEKNAHKLSEQLVEFKKLVKVKSDEIITKTDTEVVSKKLLGMQTSVQSYYGQEIQKIRVKPVKEESRKCNLTSNLRRSALEKLNNILVPGRTFEDRSESNIPEWSRTLVIREEVKSKHTDDSSLTCNLNHEFRSYDTFYKLRTEINSTNVNVKSIISTKLPDPTHLLNHKNNFVVAKGKAKKGKTYTKTNKSLSNVNKSNAGNEGFVNYHAPVAVDKTVNKELPYDSRHLKKKTEAEKSWDKKVDVLSSFDDIIKTKDLFLRKRSSSAESYNIREEFISGYEGIGTIESYDDFMLSEDNHTRMRYVNEIRPGKAKPLLPNHRRTDFKTEYGNPDNIYVYRENVKEKANEKKLVFDSDGHININASNFQSTNSTGFGVDDRNIKVQPAERNTLPGLSNTLNAYTIVDHINVENRNRNLSLKKIDELRSRINTHKNNLANTAYPMNKMEGRRENYDFGVKKRIDDQIKDVTKKVNLKRNQDSQVINFGVRTVGNKSQERLFERFHEKVKEVNSIIYINNKHKAVPKTLDTKSKLQRKPTFTANNDDVTNSKNVHYNTNLKSNPTENEVAENIKKGRPDNDYRIKYHKPKNITEPNDGYDDLDFLGKRNPQSAPHKESMSMNQKLQNDDVHLEKTVRQLSRVVKGNLASLRSISDSSINVVRDESSSSQSSRSDRQKSGRAVSYSDLRGEAHKSIEYLSKNLKAMINSIKEKTYDILCTTSIVDFNNSLCKTDGLPCVFGADNVRHEKRGYREHTPPNHIRKTGNFQPEYKVFRRTASYSSNRSFNTSINTPDNYNEVQMQQSGAPNVKKNIILNNISKANRENYNSNGDGIVNNRINKRKYTENQYKTVYKNKITPTSNGNGVLHQDNENNTKKTYNYLSNNTHTAGSPNMDYFLERQQQSDLYNAKSYHTFGRGIDKSVKRVTNRSGSNDGSYNGNNHYNNNNNDLLQAQKSKNVIHKNISLSRRHSSHETANSKPVLTGNKIYNVQIACTEQKPYFRVKEQTFGFKNSSDKKWKLKAVENKYRLPVTNATIDYLKSDRGKHCRVKNYLYKIESCKEKSRSNLYVTKKKSRH